MKKEKNKEKEKKSITIFLENVYIFSCYLIPLFLLSLIFDKQILKFIISNRIESLNLFFIYFDKINALVILSFFFIYFLLKKEYKTIKPYIINIILVYIISYTIKFLIQRPRPSLGFLPLIIKTGYSSVFSFPSGHAIAAFSILPFLKTKKEIITWFIIAIFIGFSRLYLGVHYMSDVIAGAFFGLLFAYSAKKLAEIIK